jgi:hypothetical protein
VVIKVVAGLLAGLFHPPFSFLFSELLESLSGPFWLSCRFELRVKRPMVVEEDLYRWRRRGLPVACELDYVSRIFIIII